MNAAERARQCECIQRDRQRRVGDKLKVFNAAKRIELSANDRRFLRSLRIAFDKETSTL